MYNVTTDKSFVANKTKPKKQNKASEYYVLLEVFEFST